MSISIAIDGPSGAGKSTLAKSVSKELDYLYVDTGAIYAPLAMPRLSISGTRRTLLRWRRCCRI
mgnify:CR=1 FL=1